MSQDRTLSPSTPHGVGIFDRSVETPVEALSEMEDEQIAKKFLARLHPDDSEAVRNYFMREQDDRLDLMRSRVNGLIVRVFSFCCIPQFCTVRMWGVIYALDLPIHGDLEMADRARKLGCHRATISTAARDFVKIAKLQPSRWMRADTTVEANKQARERNLIKQQP